MQTKTVKPFRALRPSKDFTSKVIAPPYDVLSSEEARMRAKDKEWSFLHISKAEIDLPPNTNPYSEEVYNKAAENLQKMIREKALLRDEKSSYYIYRMVMRFPNCEHTQTGFVLTASVEKYNANFIRKHEFTRPDKEDDRVRQIEALNAQTGPVLLAYPDSKEADQLLVETCRENPVVDTIADDGICHMLWTVSNPEMVEKISSALNKLPALYIADGHHRSAAASRVSASRKKSSEEQSSDYFLAVAFPHHQMRIMDYNRIVKDLNGLSKENFLDKMKENFTVAASNAPVSPCKQNEFGMYLDKKWYRLNIRKELVPSSDPVKRLDVSLLSDFLLSPILGIHDLRRDKRIDFVGGIRGISELEKHVDSGNMAVAFSLFPTQMADLMAVADSGEVMPPKSTWFEPKLADGLVSHVLD